MAVLRRAMALQSARKNSASQCLKSIYFAAVLATKNFKTKDISLGELHFLQECRG